MTREVIQPSEANSRSVASGQPQRAPFFENQTQHDVFQGSQCQQQILFVTVGSGFCHLISHLNQRGCPTEHTHACSIQPTQGRPPFAVSVFVLISALSVDTTCLSAGPSIPASFDGGSAVNPFIGSHARQLQRRLRRRRERPAAPAPAAAVIIFGKSPRDVG